MDMKEHRGFSHGLAPGQTQDINCPSCRRESMRIHYAVEIKAASRSASNTGQRLGWLVYTPEGDLEGFVDAGQAGGQMLYQYFPRSSTTVLCSLRVTPAEWREAKRHEIRR